MAIVTARVLVALRAPVGAFIAGIALMAQGGEFDPYDATSPC